MKRTVLPLCFLGAALGVVAQHTGPVNPGRTARTIKSDGHQYSQLHTPTPAGPAMGYRGDAFWSEDFSGGAIPAGWTNVDIGTTGGTPTVTFVWSNDPAAVAPAALGYQPSSNFNAATASNGYLWANSDRGLPSAPLSTHVTQLTTSAIDCSGQGSVQLNFQALIGVFDLRADENAVVRVSTDLTNWTTYTAFPCLVTGAAAPPCSRWSNNPQLVSVDISATAANQPTVYIQWQWTGGWEYFWALDDIELAPVPEYERVLSAPVASHLEAGLEYHRIPVDQLFSEFVLGCEMRNVGINPQTNVVLSAVVTGPGGGTAFQVSQNMGTVNPGQTVTMEQVANLPGSLTQGLYTITYTVNSDQDALETNPADDTLLRRFELNDDVYSLDGIGVHPPAIEAISSLGSNSFTNNADGLYLLNYFEIASPVTVYGMEALLATGTAANSQVIFSVHTTSDIDADNVNSPLADSDFITVTQADINNGRIAASFFGGGLELQPGGYYAGISLYSNNGEAHVRIQDDTTVPQLPGAAVIYIPTATGTSQPGIYTNGNAHAVRLLLDPSVGIAEQAGDLAGISMYPNPTDGLLWVNTEHSGNHLIEVYDMVGALVYTGNFNNLTTIDLTGLAKGVYNVRVANDKGTTVRRIAHQ